MPYIGVFYHGWYFRRIVDSDTIFHDIYLPLGIGHIGDNGVTFAAEIAFDLYYAAYLLPWGGIKLGVHF